MTEVLTRRQNSRVLQCFRAIGMIVDDVPLRWYGMGKASFATASLGKSFAVYKCDKLTPVLVSPQLPKRIAALEVLPKKHLTFTACGRQILVWKRVEQLATLTGHKGAIKQVRRALARVFWVVVLTLSGSCVAVRRSYSWSATCSSRWTTRTPS